MGFVARKRYFFVFFEILVFEIPSFELSVVSESYESPGSSPSKLKKFYCDSTLQINFIKVYSLDVSSINTCY